MPQNVGNSSLAKFPVRASLLGLAFLTGFLPLATAESVASLGDLGRGVLPAALSADNSVIVGTLDSGSTPFIGPGTRPFRWTSEIGVALDISGSPNGWASAGAKAVSADGLTVIGQASFKPFRWTSAAGMKNFLSVTGTIELETVITPSADSGAANGISADGTLIVGRHPATPFAILGSQAFRWTSSAGVEDLPLPAGYAWSEAIGVSADGSVIAGTAVTADGRSQAVRWTQSGVEMLDPLGLVDSTATAISADGTVIIGTLGERAFRWTATDGMRPLDEFTAFVPRALSADGSVIVGEAESEAFRWDKTYGLQSIASLLSVSGADLADWSLESATAISADGTIIAGTGAAPSLEGPILAQGYVIPKRGWIASGVVGQNLDLLSSITSTASEPPTIGRKITMFRKSKSVVVKGTATGPVSKVIYRARHGIFKQATGTTSWKFTAPRRSERTVVTVIAEGIGGKSPPITLVIPAR